MVTPNTLIFLTSGLTLSIALGFSLIVLWHDSRKEANQFFAIFLLFLVVWNIGSLLAEASSLIVDGSVLFEWSVVISELGFSGSSVALYILITISSGIHSKQFRIVAFIGLVLIILYRVFLIVNQNLIDSRHDGQFHPLLIVFLSFNSLILFLIWRYRRKIESSTWALGSVLFVLGQSLVFINSNLMSGSLATSVSSFGGLLISFAFVQREIITPLSQRSGQVDAIHKVSLAISSQLSLNTVLNEIAIQAAGWVGADGVGIFLPKPGDRLRLVTVYHLPKQLLATEIHVGHGVVGAVAKSRKTVFLENYGRDWKGESDFLLAKQTFGSTICVPLISASDIIGVLFVVAGHQGRLFDKEDVYLLELLGAQAAVAISHSHLFTDQQQLTKQVEAAHNQLQTVLTTTESPVVATDRYLRVMFANPAAKLLFPLTEGKFIYESVPKDILPLKIRDVLRDVRDKSGYIYEIDINQKTYLCHLAAFGEKRIEGWVSVSNDITELKELDRLKSEMVRMASHDLKNPLMGAMAHLELLSEDLNVINNPDLQKSFETIEWQLERMHRIITGILDIERLRTLPILNEVCSPLAIVNHVQDELKHYIMENNIVFKIEIDNDIRSFIGDSEKFKRVLVNLVENAVKFSLVKGVVEVSVYNQMDNIVFKVQDNGVGIPDELKERIFDRFFRGRQKGIEHITGSGLGLSLVKSIVESHNGKIWFESQAGKGSTFFVSLPALKNSTYNSYSQ